MRKAMRIQHNIAALNTHRKLNANNKDINKTLEKLSSGYKINRAGDDAAGLAISEKMRGQIRGLNMAGKNIQDGISLIQTAEGALNEVHSILQRQRELMVQAANDTNTEEDKQKIQHEVKALLEEIDNISETTHFNGIALLAGGGTIPPGGGGGTGGGTGSFAGLPPEPAVDPNVANQLVLDPNATLHEKIATMLTASALSEGVKRIGDYYGLTLSGEPMNVNIYNNPGGGALASVSYYYDTDGTGKGINLNINEAYFNEMSYPDGGTYPQYFDRVMTHELAHAVMAATTNFRSMPMWFVEGTAEFINGADERLAIDLAIEGKDDLIAAIGDGNDSSWGNSSLDYSTGYLATKYLHDKLKAAGKAGVKDVLTYMQGDTSRTFADALKDIAGYNTVKDFANDFKQNGGAFLDNLDLTNADVGAIGGADADNGSVLDARNVIDDTLASNPNDPTNGAFVLTWPQGLDTVFAKATNPYQTTQSYNMDFSLTRLAEVKIQLGANERQQVGVKLATVNTTQLGIKSINAELRADSSITKLDAAIESVSRVRSYFGAMQNRLEHSYESVMNTSENLTSAESRIRDTDMAKDMMNFTKQNILIQAAQSMLGQANQQPQGVLQLLN